MYIMVPLLSPLFIFYCVHQNLGDISLFDFWEFSSLTTLLVLHQQLCEVSSSIGVKIYNRSLLLNQFFIACFESLDKPFCSPIGLGIIWSCSRVPNFIRMHKLLKFFRYKLRPIVCNNLFQESPACKNGAQLFNSSVAKVTFIRTTSSYFEKASTIISHMCP